MAKATKHVVPPVEPEYTLTLELSQDEAELLASVLGKTGGNQSPSYQIFFALENAGVRSTHRITTPGSPTILAEKK